MVPSFLQSVCAAQLAGCEARLYNAAGPGTLRAPGALLASDLLLHCTYKIPPHVSFLLSYLNVYQL